MACEGQSIRYLRNNGTSTPFGSNPEPVILLASSPGDDITQLALGDIDGDTDLDLVVGIKSGPHRVYINNGTNNPFADLVPGGRAIPDSEFDVSKRIELVDLNQDGHLDVLSGLSFYLNDGTGSPFVTLLPRGRISANVNVPCDFVSADINGDGAPDVLTTGCAERSGFPQPPASEPFVLYLNSQGAVPFSINTQPTSTNGGPDWLLESRLLAIDIDGDNDEDIAWSVINGSVDFAYSNQQILINQGFVETPMPVLTVDFSNSVVEGEDLLSIHLTLSTPSDRPVSVSVATIPGAIGIGDSATPGQDYYGASANFVYAPGETVKTLPITILDDDLVESPSESFVVSICGVDGANVSLASPLSYNTAVSLVDNDGTDLPTLNFFSSTARESQGEHFVGAYLGFRWHKDVSFNVSTLGGIALSDDPVATPGEDYYGFAQRFTIPSGHDRVRIPITLVDDDVVERSFEYVWLQAYRPDQVKLSADRRFTYLAIADDDFPVVSIQDNSCRRITIPRDSDNQNNSCNPWTKGHRWCRNLSGYSNTGGRLLWCIDQCDNWQQRHRYVRNSAAR